jgi:4-diphosphocytidyl-2-C-methyl-D-erythritol kinase
MRCWRVPERVTGLAPAKVNLILEVLGKRLDSFHELRTVLQTLELSDTVTIASRDVFGVPVTVTGPFAPGTPADESNLAWRAAQFLAQRTGNSVDNLAVHLEKQIPPAGGLGGGASDAATTLRLLQQVWDNASDRDVFAAAAATGSDEPFFVCGGTALATGRGEHVEPVAALDDHAVVLFLPHTTIEMKTPKMFQALAATGFDDGGATAIFLEASPRRVRSNDVYNAFERVAFDVFEGLGALHADLERRTGAAIRLAGAGPTLFWIGPPGEGAAIAESAPGTACGVILTATAPSLWKP